MSLKINNSKTDDVATLMKQHHQAIEGYARLIVKDESLAEDIAQISRIKIIRSLHTFKNQSKITTWMYRIVYNTHLDYIRAKKQHPVLRIADYDYDPEINPDTVSCASLIDKKDYETDIINKMQQQFFKKIIKSSINRLSPSHREVIIDFYIKDMLYTEIANKLNIPMGTVKSRLGRAKKALEIELLRTFKRHHLEIEDAIHCS